MSYAQQMLESLQKGEDKKAFSLFNKVLSFSSDEEKFSLAEQLYSLGFLDEARQLYEQLLTAYPEEGELLILLAEVLVDMDREEEAVLLLEKLDPADEYYPRALLLLADLYQMQGLYEVSEQKIQAAYELLPDEPVVQFALAELYLEQGRFLEAVRFYKGLLSGGTQEIAGISIYQRLAESLSAGGAFEESLEYYEKAMDDHLEINTLFGYAFTAYQAGFYQTAIAKFNELKEMDPDYHSIYLYLARAYEHEEELEKSLEAAKEGIRQDEFQKELYLTAGKLSLKLSREEEAEQYLRTALALDPEFAEAGLTLNKLLLQQERYEDVLEITSMLRKDGEADPQFLWDEAKASNELEKYNEALLAYQEAYTFFKDNGSFLEEYGFFLMEEGKRTEALMVFQQLLRQDPANEEWMLLVERLQE
ncbi:tetratricopeptide repeat protein [Bacillus thermotolerans]|uniref:TPR-repeat-containing protein n=1 Tax=Bacillus thermotolerans TaxID=1221996 RepID=A0A0F5HYJ9_BACTR|nr:tetratricopeptide repeat protein [Bacillus thermotolerans]KKB37644.1 TPR-repeat-containing protein [Bacillus thermotolerans]KKB38459.1 TPR-repeat-containing protein [Bacillus thermotolerans]KKB39560.1 TPR-repeat-containing protein [Bacillus thermotolerans]